MDLSDRMVRQLKVGILRDLPFEEAIAAYQLVGGVTAHQGDDG
jgi:hypothetical protein